MATTPINTLKNWFKTNLKPTQAQFWAWLDSYRHKDEQVPAADVSGLQELLDNKVDKKDLIQNKGVFDPAKAYVFDAALAEYVSFVNEASADEFYRVERWFRLLADTVAGESPETAPAKWKHIGTVLGEIAIEDVVGLREELDALNDGGTGGGHVIQNDAGEALAQQAALQFKGVSVTNEAGKTVVDVTGKADHYTNPVLPVAAGACVIDFNTDKVYQQYAVTGTFQFQKGATNVPGKMVEVCLTADGVTGHKPTFSNDFLMYSDNWNNTNGAKNLVRFKYIQQGHLILMQIIPLS